MRDNTTTTSQQSRTLTRDEETIIRVIPKVSLISRPIKLECALTIYFCKTMEGKLFLQIIDDAGMARGPIRMTQSELESDLPDVVGLFLNDIRAGKHDRAVLDASVNRQRRIDRQFSHPEPVDPDAHAGGWNDQF